MRQIHHMWQIVRDLWKRVFTHQKWQTQKDLRKKRVFRIPPRRDMRQLEKDLLENVYSENSTHGDDGSLERRIEPRTFDRKVLE